MEIESGLINGGSIYPEFDSEVAAASYAEVVKTNTRALRHWEVKKQLGKLKTYYSQQRRLIV